MTKALKKAIEKYNNIDTAKDLRKNKLTVCDVEILRLVLMELMTYGRSETFNTSVAEWCRKIGLNVVDPHDIEVNYIISVDK